MNSIVQAKRKLSEKVFYGWIIVGIAFLIMSVAYAVYFSFPIFYVPILTEFGWSRAGTALIFSIGYIVYGFGSAMGGAVLDRFGPSKSFTIATVVMAIGLVGCSKASEIWQFYLFWGGFVALGVAMVGFVPCIALISNWFNYRRATAIGIAQAGGRECFIVTPLIQYAVLTLGWRSTFLVLTAAAVVLIIGSTQFLQHSPKDMGLLPDGEPGAGGKKKTVDRRKNRYTVDREWTAINWTLLRGLKEYRFWALFGTLGAIGTGYGVAMTHQIAFVVDVGFTAMFASFLLLIFGILSMVGRFCGFISDYIGREPAFTIGCCGVVVSLMMLLLTKDTSRVWMLYVYAICFGFFSGLNSPSYASSAADIFEGKHFGAILGATNIGYGFGNSLGAWFGGYAFDKFGSYFSAFVISIIMMIAACGLLWISSPRKIKQPGSKR